MATFRKFAPLVLLAVMSSAGCRLDMHVQPRYNPLAKSDFFPDQRSSRPRVEGSPRVEGTVARGDERSDTYFYTGKIGNNDGDFMPFPVTREVLERGRERYNVYCSPCHSRVGDGNGIIPSRGFARKPPSYHIERLQKAPIGYFFDVTTNGFGIMLDYSAQISVRDRWCIAAYIQLSSISRRLRSSRSSGGDRSSSAASRA